MPFRLRNGRYGSRQQYLRENQPRGANGQFISRSSGRARSQPRSPRGRFVSNRTSQRVSRANANRGRPVTHGPGDLQAIVPANTPNARGAIPLGPVPGAEGWKRNGMPRGTRETLLGKGPAKARRNAARASAKTTKRVAASKSLGKTNKFASGRRALLIGGIAMAGLGLGIAKGIGGTTRRELKNFQDGQFISSYAMYSRTRSGR